MRYNATTGLDSEQITELVSQIWQACCLSGVALTDAAIGRVLLVDGERVKWCV